MATVDYTTQHKAAILNAIPISPRYFEKGMIGGIYYMKKEDGKPVMKKYTILVLQPLFQGKMHALKLSEISRKILLQLFTEHGAAYSVRMNKIRKMNLPKMLMDKSSKTFYTNVIKKLLKTKLKNSYRVFTLSNIKTAMVYDYDLTDKIQIDPLDTNTKN